MTPRRFISIVSGLPRSGTSMMMQMLAAGGMPVLTDQARQPDEDNPRGYFELEAVKQLSSGAPWLAGAQGKAVKMVYLLLYDLPAGHEYRVIFMKRKLEEVMESQRAMLRRGGKGGQSPEDAALLGLFQIEVEKAEAWLSAKKHFRTLHVSYNRMLEAPEAGVEEVDRFLGGGLDTFAMRGVVDLALYRQRR